MVKDTEIFSNSSAAVIFLNGLLQKFSSYTQHIDTQSNMVVGLGSAMFVFSASRFHLDNGGISWSLFVLAVSSGLAALVGLLAINPPRLMRKRGQSESLFFHTKVSQYSSADQYYEEVMAMLESEKDFVKQASVEAYNLARYYYKPKRTLFLVARNILISGLSVSFLVYVIQVFGLIV